MEEVHALDRAYGRVKEGALENADADDCEHGKTKDQAHG